MLMRMARVGINSTTCLVFQNHLQLMSATDGNRLTWPHLTIVGNGHMHRISCHNMDWNSIKVIAVLDKDVTFGAFFCHRLLGHNHRVLDLGFGRSALGVGF